MFYACNGFPQLILYVLFHVLNYSYRLHEAIITLVLSCFDKKKCLEYINIAFEKKIASNMCKPDDVLLIY